MPRPERNLCRAAILAALLLTSAVGVKAAELSVTSLVMPPDSTTTLVVSGNITGESTYGLTILVEIVPRTDHTGTLEFTPEPPVDIVQLGDPWPGAGTFSPYDTGITGSPLLNGSVDDDGTYIPAPVTYSGVLSCFPIVASADAHGVWDVVLFTSFDRSSWEALPTTLIAGTVTVTADPCSTDADCSPGEVCVESMCVPACGLDNVIDTFPPPCAIDTRQPHPADNATPKFGWDQLVLSFDCDPTNLGLTPDDFEVWTLPDKPVPAITGVSSDSVDYTVSLTFDGPISSGCWTCVDHLDSKKRWCMGYLPADTDQNKLSAAPDIDTLIGCLNSAASAPCARWRTDLNRSGITSAPDILTTVDLLNGASAFEIWLGQTIPDCPQP